jgi:hypothetical protein
MHKVPTDQTSRPADLDNDQQDSAQVAALAASQVHPDSALPSRPSESQSAPNSAPTGGEQQSENAAAANEAVHPLKERAPSKAAEQQGLFEKFRVQRLDGSDCGGGKHYGCRYFVLDLNHDQHAPAALRAYADSCGTSHPQLAADLYAEFGRTPAADADDRAAFERWARRVGYEVDTFKAEDETTYSATFANVAWEAWQAALADRAAAVGAGGRDA